MAAIITVCRDDLRLPVVDPLHVHLYENTASLASYGFKSWVSRTDVADFAATADENKMHINLAKTRIQPWGRATWLLAHEYGHNIENEIASGHVYRARWFSEGFAEWVAAKAVEALGWQDYDLTLRRQQLELARHRGFLPRLSDLSADGWISFIRKPKGAVMTYTLAAAAVDRLIQKKGISRAIQFIRSGDFEASFGVSEADYKIDLENVGVDLGSPQRHNVSIPRPDWKVGYRWIYDQKTLGKQTTVVKQIVKDDFIRGKPVFIVKSDTEEDSYTKGTLGLLTTAKQGKVNSSRNPPSRFFAWPLDSGKDWENSYQFKDFNSGESSRENRRMIVPGIVEIAVPAGTFLAAKIEAYNNVTGRLIAEYWYAPAAKWFVKSILYGGSDGFPRVEELQSFAVDP